MLPSASFDVYIKVPPPPGNLCYFMYKRSSKGVFVNLFFVENVCLFPHFAEVKIVTFSFVLAGNVDDPTQNLLTFSVYFPSFGTLCTITRVQPLLGLMYCTKQWQY